MTFFFSRWRVVALLLVVFLGVYGLSRWLWVVQATSAQLAHLPPFSQAVVSGTVLAPAERAGDRALWPVRDAAGVFTLTLPLAQVAAWPAPGDTITVQGWVNAPQVHVADPATLARQAAPAVRAQVAALQPQLEGQTLIVRGWVESVLESRVDTPLSTLTLFVTDSTGALTLVVPASTHAWQGTAWPALQPGDVVEATGVADFLTEPPTLRVARLDALVVNPPALGRGLADTPLGEAGTFTLTVQAVEVRRFSALVRAAEATIQAWLIVPVEVWQAAPVRPGGQVRVRGELSWEAGARAVQVRSSADWQVRAPGTPPTQATPLAELGLRQVGQWALVRGTVQASAPLEGGTRLTVQDDTGLLTVVVWGEAPTPLPGATVLVEGPLSVFASELQLTAVTFDR